LDFIIYWRFIFMSQPITRKRAHEQALVQQQNVQEGPINRLLLPEVLNIVTHFLSLNQTVRLRNVCHFWRILTPTFIEQRIAQTTFICYRELNAFRHACGLGYLSNTPRLGTLLKNFPKLEVFILGEEEIPLNQLKAIGKAFSAIKVIDARGHLSLTHTKLEALLVGCSKLESLSLANCPLVHCFWMDTIIINCPSLEEINLSGTGIPNFTLRKLAEFCTNLKRVNITGCNSVTDEGIAYLTNRNIEIVNNNGMNVI
jgi:hypothetical protein